MTWSAALMIFTDHSKSLVSSFLLRVHGVWVFIFSARQRLNAQARLRVYSLSWMMWGCVQLHVLTELDDSVGFSGQGRAHATNLFLTEYWQLRGIWSLLIHTLWRTRRCAFLHSFLMCHLNTEFPTDSTHCTSSTPRTARRDFDAGS